MNGTPTKPKPAHGCSFIYKTTPIFVDPNLKTKGRCTIGKCKVYAQPKASFLFDDDGNIVDGNSGSKNCSYTLRAQSKRQENTAIKARKEAEDPCTSYGRANQAQSQTTYVRRVGLKDASTFTDKPPEFETADAYFADHPILDFIGTCSGVLILVIFLWYVFRWYVWIIDIAPT
ncbi:unnamed protein product [Nippostrongylus brasiliensis]|uniref:Uncharacterized protein n=1 Tax=Nippostrongylus brasiliensis TaxID=27835 RepID=A0A0N4YWJ3_NIPBR|nr:unnamed protein product [Nippostrongylus brasiliensis]